VVTKRKSGPKKGYLNEKAVEDGEAVRVWWELGKLRGAKGRIVKAETPGPGLLPPYPMWLPRDFSMFFAFHTRN